MEEAITPNRWQLLYSIQLFIPLYWKLEPSIHDRDTKGDSNASIYGDGLRPRQSRAVLGGSKHVSTQTPLNAGHVDKRVLPV